MQLWFHAVDLITQRSMKDETVSMATPHLRFISNQERKNDLRVMKDERADEKLGNDDFKILLTLLLRS